MDSVALPTNEIGSEQHTEAEFLGSFCNSLVACDFSILETFFHLPAIIVNDNDKHVFNSYEDLQQWLAAYCQRVEVSAKNGFDLKLIKSINLSEKVRFSQVSLSQVSIKDTLVALSVSFTLAKDEINQKTKIIIAVLDDV